MTDQPEPNAASFTQFLTGLFWLATIIVGLIGMYFAANTTVNLRYHKKIMAAQESFYMMKDCVDAGRKDCGELVADFQNKDREVREYPNTLLYSMFPHKN